MYATCCLFDFAAVLLFILETVKFFSLSSFLYNVTVMWFTMGLFLTLCWAPNGPFHSETHVFQSYGITFNYFINNFLPLITLFFYSFALLGTPINQVLKLLEWSSNFLIFHSYFSSQCSFALYDGANFLNFMVFVHF